MVAAPHLVIAHRLSTVQRSIASCLRQGKHRREGTHQQLIRRDLGVYRRLFENQAL